MKHVYRPHNAYSNDIICNETSSSLFMWITDTHDRHIQSWQTIKDLHTTDTDSPGRPSKTYTWQTQTVLVDHQRLTYDRHRQSLWPSKTYFSWSIMSKITGGAGNRITKVTLTRIIHKWTLLITVSFKNDIHKMYGELTNIFLRIRSSPNTDSLIEPNSQ